MTTATHSDIFTAYCSDLLVSADNIDALFDFSAIAITAWNSSHKTGDDLVHDIVQLKKRMKREVVKNGDVDLHVDDLVKQMLERKYRHFSEHSFKVVKAGFENEANRIRVNVEVAVS